MRLRKVRLQNYRNHSDSVIDLSNTSFCVIRGANASGKSSIAQAISLNLSSTTMGLGAAGQGFVEKIKHGEHKATITTEIQGQHILENKVTLNTNSSGRTQVIKCLDDPDNNRAVVGLSNFLTRYKDAFRICLNTDAFTKLGEKEQKDILASLVLPSHYDFPKDKVEAVSDVLGGEKIDFNGEPFSVIEKAYKGLYKERETANRYVKEFVVPEPLPMPSGIDSASMQKELTEIREKRGKLQAERDKAVSKANAVEIERGKLQTKIEHLRGEVRKGTDRLKELDEEILPDGKLKALQALAARSSELIPLQKDKAAYEAAICGAREQIDRLRGLADKGATCPTCDQPIDPQKISEMAKELEEEIADGKKKIDAIQGKIAAIGDIEGIRDEIRGHEFAVKEKANLEKSLKETVAEGKKTGAALKSIGQKVDATLPFNDPLGNLQAQEDKIVEQLRPVIASEERAKDIEEKTKELNRLQKKASTLDTLVKYFDKDGIKSTLISQYIGGFQSKLYSVLSAWGYKAELASDLSSFNVTTPRGYTGPVKELSGAEEHIFKAAFQCAVSIAAGIGLVVIDEVEELGEDIRQPLYGSVFSLIQSKQLEQAILIGYSLDKTVPPVDKRAPGSRYFYVENGTVEELG